MALDFTITTPTTAIGAGTPSRAITLTLTGSGTLGSDASFALTDGGAGGIFYPASPVKILSGQTVGATTQFVYIAPSAATGTITLQAVCTGGLSATHTLALPIGTSTVFLKDLFSGTLDTDLASHSPDIGGSWTRQANGGTARFHLTGSGSLYQSVTSSSLSTYTNSANPTTTEFDVQCNWVVYDNTVIAAHYIVSDANASSGAINGYGLTGYNNPTGEGWYSQKYVANSGTTWLGPVNSPAVVAGMYTGLQAIRSINGSQYVFAFAGGSLLGDPTADSSFATKVVGVWANSISATQTASNGIQLANLYGRNVDWTPPPPIGVPAAPLVARLDPRFLFDREWI